MGKLFKHQSLEQRRVKAVLERKTSPFKSCLDKELRNWRSSRDFSENAFLDGVPNFWYSNLE
jgi:hypothetical protein